MPQKAANSLGNLFCWYEHLTVVVVLFINLFHQSGFMKVVVAAMHLTLSHNVMSCLFHSAEFSACTHGVLLVIMAFLSCLPVVLVCLLPLISCFLSCHGDCIMITVIEHQLQCSLQPIQGDY